MATKNRSLLRVLCLHDAHSNSAELSEKLQILGEKLYRNHGIDLVFVDAPLIVDPEDESDDPEEEGAGESFSRRMHPHPPRAWWEEDRSNTTERQENHRDGDDDEEDENQNPNAVATPNDTDPSSDSQEPQHPPAPALHYVGLDASLLLLRQVWNSAPFWGILAVGQAAGVAAVLALLPTTHDTKPPSFLIFVQGQTLLGEEESLVDHLAMPCLHVVDDPRLTQEEPLPALARSDPTRRLIRQFGGTVVCDASRWACSRAPDSSSRVLNNHVGRFLVAQKKRLRKSVQDVAVLALQHELHRTEADASQLVAQQIAQHPPDALMAVITPKDVGGFRDRRRGFGEEGGGAPCPSEFLLHRAKRGVAKPDAGTQEPEKGDPGASAGKTASRHHPNQQTNEPQQNE